MQTMAHQCLRLARTGTWRGAVIPTMLFATGHMCGLTGNVAHADAAAASPPPPPPPAKKGLLSRMFGSSSKHPASSSHAVLEYDEDKYDGVIVKAGSLPATKGAFHDALRNSLHTWRENQKRGVWLKIPTAKLEFASVAAEMGFTMHHAETGYLMMTHWLSADENHLPPNATHQVGVGCVVLNPDGKMLCVQEKNGPLKGLGVWKVPTGLADPQENLDDAAKREVFEETGIETDFVGILCFRQAHGFLFDKSDLFFVCLMAAKTTDIVKQESEIAACDWIDIDTYCQQSVFMLSPLHSKLNAHIRSFIKGEGRRVVMEQLMLTQGFRPGLNGLYLPTDAP